MLAHLLLYLNIAHKCHKYHKSAIMLVSNFIALKAFSLQIHARRIFLKRWLGFKAQFKTEFCYRIPVAELEFHCPCLKNLLISSKLVSIDFFYYCYKNQPLTSRYLSSYCFITQGGCQFGQLTIVGQNGSFELGRWLRKEYVEKHRLVSSLFDSKEVL